MRRRHWDEGDGGVLTDGHGRSVKDEQEGRQEVLPSNRRQGFCHQEEQTHRSLEKTRMNCVVSKRAQVLEWFFYK